MNERYFGDNEKWSHIQVAAVEKRTDSVSSLNSTSFCDLSVSTLFSLFG